MFVFFLLFLRSSPFHQGGFETSPWLIFTNYAKGFLVIDVVSDAGATSAFPESAPSRVQKHAQPFRALGLFLLSSIFSLFSFLPLFLLPASPPVSQVSTVNLDLVGLGDSPLGNSNRLLKTLRLVRLVKLLRIVKVTGADGLRAKCSLPPRHCHLARAT